MSHIITVRSNCECVLYVPAYLLLILLSILTVPGTFAQGVDNCVQTKQALAKKKETLSEYIDAAQRAAEHGKVRSLTFLNKNIELLVEEINTLEKRAECSEKEHSNEHVGLSPVKSDLSSSYPYLTKSCSELRRSLIKHIRLINELRNRKNGFFSEFSRADEAELLKAKQMLKKIRVVLRARCMVPSTSTSYSKWKQIGEQQQK